MNTPTHLHTNHPRIKPELHRWLWMSAAFALCFLTARARAEVFEMEALEIGAGVLFDTGVLMPAGDSVPGGSLVIDTGTLVMAPTAKLDMRRNAMVVRTGNFATIEGYAITGYNGGAWDGFGIQSSDAASDPNHLGAVGVINNADAHLAEFFGVTLGSNLEILVAYTYYGDANLDREVNEADLALMGLGSGGLGTGWYYGDFNYSGAVDAADFALYAASFNALHPVPEPGVVGLIAIGAIGCLRRSRR